MKNVVMLIASGMMGVLILAIVMTIGGAMNRREEVESNLSAAMEKTIERAVESTAENYDWKAVAAEYTQCMAYSIDTDSKVYMNVYQIDAQKGVLAMRITELFQHPNGKEGKAKEQRTVIYNQVKEEEEQYYKVQFYNSKEDMLAGKACYKSYTLLEGERVGTPVQPQNAGALFLGWKDKNDYFADFSVPIEQDLIYYASWTY